MNTWQERVSRVGFLTSVVSYALFWLADLARPGLVARYLSVHVFLLAAVAFGVWWTLAVREYRDWPALQTVVAALFGGGAAVAAWNVGAGFGDERLLAVAVAFAVPFVVRSLLRS